MTVHHDSLKNFTVNFKVCGPCALYLMKLCFTHLSLRTEKFYQALPLVFRVIFHKGPKNDKTQLHAIIIITSGKSDDCFSSIHRHTISLTSTGSTETFKFTWPEGIQISFIVHPVILTETNRTYMTDL